MRSLALGICVLVSSLAWMATAQAAESDHAPFPPPEGARVRVDASSPVLRHHDATVMACTADTLWIGQSDEQAWTATGHADRQLRAIPAGSITHLDMWQSSGSRGHNTLVGAGLGALIAGAAGGAIGLTFGKGCGDCGEGEGGLIGLAVGIPAGLAVGIVVGALWPTGKWVDVHLPEKTSFRSPEDDRFEIRVTMRRF